MSQPSLSVQELTHDVQGFIAQAPVPMLIGGEWVNAASGKSFPTFDPSTGEPLAEVAEGDADDIDRAVRAAREAFEQGPWRTMSPAERGEALWRLADLMLRDTDTLAQLETLDNGRPFTTSRREITTHARHFRYHAGWASKLEGETIPEIGRAHV